MALSYVWGPTPTQTTEGEPPQSDHVGHLPWKLSKTIEDAIDATLQLGFNYLWVDKYCIDQSTGEHELLVQLSSMDSIYEGATVTIVAGVGSNADFGLPGVNGTRRVGHPSITFDGKTWVSGSRITQALVLDSKWITRVSKVIRLDYVRIEC